MNYDDNRRHVYGTKDLWQAVDDYAEEHGHNFSQVVVKAVRRFLTQENEDAMRRRIQDRLSPSRYDRSER